MVEDMENYFENGIHAIQNAENEINDTAHAGSKVLAVVPPI